MGASGGGGGESKGGGGATRTPSALRMPLSRHPASPPPRPPRPRAPPRNSAQPQVHAVPAVGCRQAPRGWERGEGVPPQGTCMSQQFPPATQPPAQTPSRHARADGDLDMAVTAGDEIRRPRPIPGGGGGAAAANTGDADPALARPGPDDDGGAPDPALAPAPTGNPNGAPLSAAESASEAALGDPDAAAGGRRGGGGGVRDRDRDAAPGCPSESALPSAPALVGLSSPAASSRATRADRRTTLFLYCRQAADSASRSRARDAQRACGAQVGTPQRCRTVGRRWARKQEANNKNQKGARRPRAAPRGETPTNAMGTAGHRM